MSEHWENQAECLGAPEEIFFPPRGASIKPARAICAECVVKEECLEDNLDQNQGVFSGTTYRQRVRIRNAADPEKVIKEINEKNYSSV